MVLNAILVAFVHLGVLRLPEMQQDYLPNLLQFLIPVQALVEDYNLPMDYETGLLLPMRRHYRKDITETHQSNHIQFLVPVQASVEDYNLPMDYETGPLLP